MNKANGFTLIELMIVIAIAGILAAIAVPQYSLYTKRAKFADVMVRANTVKTAVDICIQGLNELPGCSGGDNGVPPDQGSAGHLASITTVDGKITATGSQQLDSHTYVLTPVLDTASHHLHWIVGGSCKNDRIC